MPRPKQGPIRQGLDEGGAFGPSAKETKQTRRKLTGILKKKAPRKASRPKAKRKPPTTKAEWLKRFSERK